MKYTTVLLSLAAVATAANIPNTNAPNTVARGEGHHHDGHPEHDTHTAVSRDESHGPGHHHHNGETHRDDQSLDSMGKRSPRRQQPSDTIDTLDASGPVPGATYHHGGPFDATLKDRNRNKTAVARGEGHHHDGHPEHNTHTAVARGEGHHHDGHPEHNTHTAVARGEGHHHDGHPEHNTHTAVARDESHGPGHHHHDGETHRDDQSLDSLGKRSPRRSRSRFRNKSKSRYRNDASGVMKLKVGLLVVGLGAGVGAIFL